jgi:Ca2+-transporting ATPase
MVSGFEREGRNVYFAKGDPGVILKLCKQGLTSSGVQKNLTMEARIRLNGYRNEISKSGETVIALAYSFDDGNGTPKSFTFLCMLELENKLQAGVQEIIQEANSIGIRSLLLTGDRIEAAVKVGFESGIAQNPRIYLTGPVVEQLPLSEISRQIEFCSVYARLLPSQKGILILRLQQLGHHVAMVGDGPNDGLALKLADVGISFVEDSSPIARKQSALLISNLTNLLQLLAAASQFRMWMRNLKIIRWALIAVILIASYAWLLISNI